VYILFRSHRCRYFPEWLGNKLYHRLAHPGTQLYPIVFMVAITSPIPTHAIKYLAISSIPTGHCNILFGFHDLCGGLNFQLHINVATRFWTKCAGSTSFLILLTYRPQYGTSHYGQRAYSPTLSLHLYCIASLARSCSSSQKQASLSLHCYNRYNLSI
jgi:hypothetical protein